MQRICTSLVFSLFGIAFTNAQDRTAAYLAKSGTSVNAVAWSNDGEHFATSWNNTTILFEAETNNIISIYSNSADNTINPFTDITTLEFSPDNLTILSVHDNNTAMVHSIGSTGSAFITGTGNKLIDATYVGNSFRLVIPIDEQNLYECLRQQGTGDYSLEKKLDLSVRPLALTANGKDGKVFVTLEDGISLLINSRTWEILGDIQTYTATKLYPGFSPDTKHFFTAVSDTQIMVSNIDNPEEKYFINDDEGFVCAAQIIGDGTKIAAATSSGYVRVYDIQSGIQEFSFQLEDLDYAKSLAASPDGEFILIGTAMGYIYRWSLHGYEFNKDEKKYIDDEGNIYNPNPFFKGKPYGLENSVCFGAEYGTLPYYYSGTYGFEADYRNYDLYPLHWGAGGRIGAGIPSKSFPYTYKVDGKEINKPWAYSIVSTVNGGLSYFNEAKKLLVFSEIGLGYAMRFLYNNEFKYAHAGKLYCGGIGEISIGAQYHWLKATIGFQYDTNIGPLFKATLGYSMTTNTFKKLLRIGNKNEEDELNAEPEDIIIEQQEPEEELMEESEAEETEPAEEIQEPEVEEDHSYDYFYDKYQKLKEGSNS